MSGPSPRSRRAIRCTIALTSLIALFSTTLASVAAQDAEEAPSVDLQLVAQRVWQRPSDPLDIRLRVVNRGIAPLEGFLLSVTAHPVVATRSALHASFEGNAGATASATSQRFTEEVAPDDSVSITLDETFETPSSLLVGDEGVYPVTISLSDAAGVVPYDSLTTPLILYPVRPKDPLNLAIVLPMNDLPSRGPDGLFRSPIGGETIPLEAAVAKDGWFSGVVAALERNAGELPDRQRTVTDRLPRRGNRPPRTRTRTVSVPRSGLHLALAPTPRLLEELADMADGYRTVDARADTGSRGDAGRSDQARDLVARFRAITEESGIQTLLVPYSFPDLPALARYAPDRIEPELDDGAEVVADVLGQEPSRDWLFPPAGRLAAGTLEELRFAEPDVAEHAVFEPDAFEVSETVAPEGCPETFASFTCPVSVRTSAGRTSGLVGDQGLQDRFIDLEHEDGGRLELQNFFAETAAIRQELPSVADRVAQVTIPSLWHPSPRRMGQLLAGLRRAPWLRTVTPAEALELRKAVDRTADLVESLPRIPSDPGESLFDAIAETSAFIDAFRRMDPPDQMVQRLRRNTLVAESRIWWSGAALAGAATDYLRGSVEIAREEIAKVTVAGPEEINLTSREGEIPLVVANRTSFPTTVRIAMRSPERDLVLDPPHLPAQRIEAGGTFQFTVQAVARSSGIFQMQVMVDTPEGELDIATKSITIRSTAFNRIALGITVGALAFLVLFYLLRLFKRRRAAPS